MSTPQLSTISSLQTTVAAQATAATAQAARIAALEASGSGADLAATAQAARIAALEASGSGTDLTICGSVSIESDAELALYAPATRTCVYMSGQLYIRGAAVSNATLLAEAFANLRTIQPAKLGEIRNGVGNLNAWGLGNPTVDPNIFLESLYLEGTNLATLEGSFPNLQTVAGTLAIQNNPLLTTIGSGFSNLQYVRRVEWYNNACRINDDVSTAGSRSFCTSAREVLCTVSGVNIGRHPSNTCPDDAYACCTAYCATTTDC